MKAMMAQGLQRQVSGSIIENQTFKDKPSITKTRKENGKRVFSRDWQDPV
ncbi:MAG: hypothetical protein IJY03_07255 [Prevotella sp.]|nr:hypothetical protein [Prevotella sp.]